MVPHPPPYEHDEHDRPVPTVITGRLPLTVAAQQAGLSRWTVAGWIARGHLPVVWIDRRRYVRPADVATAQAFAHVEGVIPAWRQDRQRAGWRLRALREAAGWTQLELAARSGQSHEAISLLETGKRAPLAATVYQLAHALRVEPAVFVSEAALASAGIPVVAAAVRLGVPVGRVQRWLATGTLTGVKVSGQWRVAIPSVTALARSNRLRGRSRRLDPRYRG